MPFTQEPKGLAFINNINMAAFGSLVTQCLWAAGSLVLTVADYQLLMGDELQRQAGIFLAGILVGAWTGKTIAGVVDAQQKRMADPRAKDVIEAKERGKVAGAAAAVVLAEKAEALKQARLSGVFYAPPTNEHPAQPPVKQEVNVNVGDVPAQSESVPSDNPAPGRAVEP